MPNHRFGWVRPARATLDATSQLYAFDISSCRCFVAGFSALGRVEWVGNDNLISFTSIRVPLTRSETGAVVVIAKYINLGGAHSQHSMFSDRFPRTIDWIIFSFGKFAVVRAIAAIVVRVAPAWEVRAAHHGELDFCVTSIDISFDLEHGDADFLVGTGAASIGAQVATFRHGNVSEECDKGRVKLHHVGLFLLLKTISER
mmetsp:Transcript_9389/g.17918  ORF Transcript_9389/g.17918 Transcript_9389/m.17918 type:complete len:201 (+) Transcript_9389:87-689(+)